MVSPVTESEITEAQTFFERISSTIVAHSAQVREIGELRQRMDEITRRLNDLTNESEHLRKDLSQAWEYNARLEQERNEAKRVAEEASADAMRARTETVQVRQETERQLAMASDGARAQADRIQVLEDKLRETAQSRSDWVERSNRWEKLAKDNAEKLALVQAALADVRSLFEPKEVPATVAGNEPQQVINF